MNLPAPPAKSGLSHSGPFELPVRPFTKFRRVRFGQMQTIAATADSASLGGVIKGAAVLEMPLDTFELKILPRLELWGQLGAVPGIVDAAEMEEEARGAQAVRLVSRILHSNQVRASDYWLAIRFDSDAIEPTDLFTARGQWSLSLTDYVFFEARK